MSSRLAFKGSNFDSRTDSSKLLFSGVQCQQASITVRPDALWTTNEGTHSIVQGSVIQLFCLATDSDSPQVIWTKDGLKLKNDPPHIRIRTSLSKTKSVLTVDNFGVTDSGSYVCMATTAAGITSNSSQLILTGVYVAIGMSCINARLDSLQTVFLKIGVY